MPVKNARPLGAIDEDRTDRFVPLTRVFEALSARFPLSRAGRLQMLARADEGWVLGMGYGYVDSIAKLIPAPPGKTVTLAKVPDKPDSSVIYARKEAPELEQREAAEEEVAELLALRGVTKAGFGLGDDRKRISAKLGVEPADVLELNTVFRQRGYRKEMGVKGAVAVLFQQRFIKSKKAATSNWAQPRLSEAQLLYAANDAWAAIRVFHALGLTSPPAA